MSQRKPSVLHYPEENKQNKVAVSRVSPCASQCVPRIRTSHARTHLDLALGLHSAYTLFVEGLHSAYTRLAIGLPQGGQGPDRASLQRERDAEVLQKAEVDVSLFCGCLLCGLHADWMTGPYLHWAFTRLDLGLHSVWQ